MFRPFKRKRSNLTEADIVGMINKFGIANVNFKQFFKKDILFTEAFFEKYIINDANFVITLLNYQQLSESFLQKILDLHKNGHFDKLYQHMIIYQDLSEDFITKNNTFVVHGNRSHYEYLIFNYQNVSEKFIRLNHPPGSLSFYGMWFRQKLSEQFLEDYINEINWAFVSRYQDLSEAFIEKYSKNVKWGSIFAFQALSPDFILKHQKKFKQNTKAKILANKKIRKNADFISKLGNLFDVKDLEIDSESALEIIEANKFKFNLDHFLKSANENSLCDLAKFLAV
jgi:hypothetical protein